MPKQLTFVNGFNKVNRGCNLLKYKEKKIGLAVTENEPMQAIVSFSGLLLQSRVTGKEPMQAIVLKKL